MNPNKDAFDDLQKQISRDEQLRRLASEFENEYLGEFVAESKYGGTPDAKTT